MTLHTTRHGTHGPTLVLIHGWGLNGAVFDDLALRLAHRFRVVAVDLPGHGRSPLPEGEYSLTALAAAVHESAGPGAIWLGWSLGGLVALAGAAAGLAQRLVLVGSTASFVRRAGWPHGMEEGLLAQFARALTDDFEATLLRFLALQARGSERGREEIRLLRERLFSHGRPAPAALAGGLELLRSTDLRAPLPTLPCPLTVIHGANDRLIPPAAAEATAAAVPGATLHLLPGAGHAPFLSHPEPFAALLEPLA